LQQVSTCFADITMSFYMQTEEGMQTPYPEDPTTSQAGGNIFVLPSGQEAARGYIPATPSYMTTTATNIRRTNTAPAQNPPNPNPNPPNPPNPGPGVGAVNQPNAPNGRKEVRMNLPSEFDGDRKKYKKFRQAVVLYLSVN
jgi:hypothetical protein